MTRLHEAALAAAILTALTGCPEATAIWLAPDADVSRAVFVLGPDRARSRPIDLGMLRVDTCEAVSGGGYPDAAQALWFLEAVEEAPAVERLVYGEVPSGMSEVRAARQLERGGCYVVTLTGSGHLRFTVDADGRLEELESG